MSNENEDCAILLTIRALCKKWSIYVLAELLVHEYRYFSDLQKALINASGKNISGRVLTDTLNDLENEELIKRIVLTEHKPVRVQYTLTEKGKDLEFVFAVLKSWGLRWGGESIKKCKSYTCIHNSVKAINFKQLKKLSTD